jgi:cytochrome c553
LAQPKNLDRLPKGWPVATPERALSNTPVQALALMNNRIVVRQAGLFAKRLEREAERSPPPLSAERLVRCVDEEVDDQQATKLSDQDIDDLGAYFSLQPIHGAGETDPAKLKLGQRVYRSGNVNSKVTSCAGCHGPDGRGNEPAGYASIQGQHATYVAAQLRAYREMSSAVSDADLHYTAPPALRRRCRSVLIVPASSFVWNPAGRTTPPRGTTGSP